MTGRWAQRSHFQPKFFVPDFVKPDTLKDILPYLPDSEVSHDIQGRLQAFQQALPREVGGNILDKLLKFWNEADAAYLSTAVQMETIHSKIAHATQVTYATLEEIAEKCLSGTVVRAKDGSFHQPTLYALHRRILGTDIEIRAQSKGTLRAGGEYEIASLSEVDEARQVEAHVRKYVEQRMRATPDSQSDASNPVEQFAKDCRFLIDVTRKSQKFTSYGMIGPPSGDDNSTAAKWMRTLGANTRLFVRFIESWCGLQSFSRGSGLAGIGSILLRAVDRYDDVDLDARTAWTFLQEVGAIPFWETPHAYLLKLPDVGQRLRAEPKAPIQGFGNDRSTAIRKDWGNMPVYCIDDVGAHEIDDGVSVERTDTDEQYWVHVHVADPASHVEPTSPVAEFAQKFVTNVYLPGQVASMLDPDYIQSNFSMGSGRPCLTFSAKLDADGEILDYKVSAGRINDVIYITPDVLEEASKGPQHGELGAKDVYVAGGRALPPLKPSREMTAYEELTAGQKQELAILRSLGMLRSSHLRSKGGLSFASSAYNMAIHLDTSRPANNEQKPFPRGLHKTARSWKGKPMLEITKDRGAPKPNSPLSYLMILAGQVCATWCKERGIPTIYRITPYNPSKELPADFFRRVVAPSQGVDGNVPIDIALQYLQIVGAAQPSTKAGPHVAVGADMFSKCTSPLRRYGDLLMHWQIGAALLEEHRLGCSLVGNTDESLFPFSTAQINRLLPRIDTRERLSRKVSNDARNSWFCQFFIRAWKFGEAELPKNLSFVIKAIFPRRNQAVGQISQFDFPAILCFDQNLKYDQALPGQEVEVDVLDIDMPQGKILLSPKPRGPTMGPEAFFKYGFVPSVEGTKDMTSLYSH